MRQQRTDNARGRVQRPNIRPIPDITWLIVSAGVHECRILLGVPNTDVHLQGIPQMVYGTDGSTPESATIDTNYLHLNYASPSSLHVIFSCRPQTRQSGATSAHSSRQLNQSLQSPLNRSNPNNPWTGVSAASWGTE